MVQKVKKRSGKVEKFSRSKLLKSIHDSMHMMNINNVRIEESVVDDITKTLKKKKTADSEDIRDAVCRALRKNKYHKVCDAYSLIWLHAKPVGIRYVVKRNGSKEKFSPEKVFESVQKSFKHAYTSHNQNLVPVTREVLTLIRKRKRGNAISTEQINNIVEYTLMKRDFPQVAKHYILYRYM